MGVGADPPIIAGKLNAAEWNHWPDREQEVVRQFFHSAWAAVINAHPEEQISAGSWLCALVRLGEPPAPLMEEWLSSGSANAALQMANFIRGEAKHLNREGVVRGPFWEELDERARSLIGQWLTSSRAKAFLASAAEAVSEEDRFFYIDAALSELTRKY